MDELLKIYKHMEFFLMTIIVLSCIVGCWLIYIIIDNTFFNTQKIYILSNNYTQKIIDYDSLGNLDCDGNFLVYQFRSITQVVGLDNKPVLCEIK